MHDHETNLLTVVKLSKPNDFTINGLVFKSQLLSWTDINMLRRSTRTRMLRFRRRG